MNETLDEIERLVVAAEGVWEEKPMSEAYQNIMRVRDRLNQKRDRRNPLPLQLDEVLGCFRTAKFMSKETMERMNEMRGQVVSLWEQPKK